MNNSGEPDGGVVWHYTTSAGLKGIVENHAIRASSAAFMNDASEMRTGVRALAATYQRIKLSLTADAQNAIEQSSLLRESSVDHWFLSSASKARDLLTLWRSYGAAAPYALGFDASVKLSPVEYLTGDAHPNPPPGYYEDSVDEVDGRPVQMYDPDEVGVFGGTWRTVNYIDPAGRTSHEATLREFAERYTRATDFGRLFVDVGAVADSAVNYDKHEAFEDEREVRLIFEVAPLWKFVQYRESRFGLVPFIEIGAGGIPASLGEYVPREARRPLPLAEVMIGPSPLDPNAAERALRDFLDNRGYGEVRVTRSETPFR